ncbi:Glutamyl aminopeptidase, partial [Stegodyphus mimosarum]
MAKVFVPQSSCIFAVIIFLLLVLSVGLLVFVLKGQLHHENSMSSRDMGHVGDSAVAGVVTHTPSPQTASKTVTNRSTVSQLDVDHTTESIPEDHRPWEDFRLPKYIIPMHYDLLLYPNLETDIFTGTVNITVNVTRQTKHFVVHAYRLTVKDSKVYDKTGSIEYGVNKHFLYDLHEYLVVEMDNIILPTTYKLSFNFNGSLLGSIVGFYKSRYTNSNNETRFLATSKFQPTYARRAFPCFDEPSFKATFSVSLVHTPSYIALSNMPVEVTESFPDSSQLLVTKFQKSVPMVTYLACFIVCDFKYRSTKTSSGKEFRVYSAPDQVNKTAYALNFGSRVLEYFENYFGIAYPLPKQDMVAIPDFVSGAMEHWGVITFRETNLLYDKQNSSPQNKQR